VQIETDLKTKLNGATGIPTMHNCFCLQRNDRAYVHLPSNTSADVTSVTCLAPTAAHTTTGCHVLPSYLTGQSGCRGQEAGDLQSNNIRKNSAAFDDSTQSIGTEVRRARRNQHDVNAVIQAIKPAR